MSAATMVDLTQFFERWAKLIIAQMRRRRTQNRGIDGAKDAPLAAPTLADRKRRGITSTTRLRDTGALMRDGFVSECKPLKLEIGLSDAPHPRGGGSFDQVGAWNEKTVTAKPYNSNWWGVPQKMADDLVAKAEKEVERQLFANPIWGSIKEYRVRASA